MKNLRILTLCLFVLFIGVSALTAKTEQKLISPDQSVLDKFGIDVAVSGDTVVVGASSGNPLGPVTGAAYVYHRNQGGGDAWGHVATLTASDLQVSSRFGAAVDIDGDLIIIGAPDADASGAAYIFLRNQGGPDAWGEVVKLEPPGVSAGSFGSSVGISGETAVVGDLMDGTQGTQAGAAVVFVQGVGGPTDWDDVATLFPSGHDSGNNFGIAVDIDGDLVVAGELYGNGAEDFTGAAYVFGRHVGGTDGWGEMEKMSASNGNAYDFFGADVAIDGDTVIVGASRVGTISGSAYLFRRDEGGTDAWGEVKIIPPPGGATGEYFGSSVALSGTTIVCGAPFAEGTNGATYGFSRNHGGDANWGLAATLTASDGANGDQFGTSIAKDGSTIVVGAPFESGAGSSSGAAYIYFTPSGEIFNDGFEGGDSSVWDSTAN